MNDNVIQEEKRESAQFDIPVVLFIMKRTENSLKVLSGVRKVKPSKVYIISDEGRNEKEKVQVAECRKAIEDAIDWQCEVIKNYADENRGVLDRIGLGAKWVFEREDLAIFLEDDNMPEETFFTFCKEMLLKYKNNSKILWVCGTNYLTQYNSPENYSYVFTKHTLPCGWASWAEKFNRYYDAYLEGLNDSFLTRNFRGFYSNRALERQKEYFINSTSKALKANKKPSWDHQMTYTLMAHELYGIAPRVNLIKNIGVDAETTHGGASLRNPMTKRFCGMESLPLEFPLKHPPTVIPDKIYEKKVGKIIKIPFWYMSGIKFAAFMREKLKIGRGKSFSQIIFRSKR